MSNAGQKARVAVGISGGVDSALSAHLLVEQGYDVTGVYLECWNELGCRNDQDRQDALQIALNLGIPFQVLDFKQAYRETVLNYFLTEYQAGRTPNPDVLCNREIKFGLFYNWAMHHEFEYVATGHYARVGKYQDQPVLLSSTDLHKDQTYFLHLLKGEQLNHILFPIGHLTKPEVRAEAQARKINVSTKKDSTGICFVGEINVRDFLEEKLGENPGNVVDPEGQVIGEHRGLWFYTIGQRQGFTIDTKALLTKSNLVADKHNPPPLFVIGKNQEKNELRVGLKADTTSQEISLYSLHTIQPEVKADTQQSVLVRIRHTGELIPAQYQNGHLHLTEKTSGIAPGQSAVLYREVSPGDVEAKSSNSSEPLYLCLGGGVIAATVT